jgi:uncharacterized membrane protein
MYSEQAMFKRISKFKTHHRILFSIVIGFSVVAFWRGAWGLMDVYVFPDNYELSSWASLILGIVVLYITHSIIKELADD